MSAQLTALLLLLINDPSALDPRATMFGHIGHHPIGVYGCRAGGATWHRSFAAADQVVIVAAIALSGYARLVGRPLLAASMDDTVAGVQQRVVGAIRGHAVAAAASIKCGVGGVEALVVDHRLIVACGQVHRDANGAWTEK